MTHHDPLVMQIRNVLQQVEPREMPTEIVKNDYGYDCWVCPYCSDLIVVRSWRGKEYAGYNKHFALKHGTPFWREQQVAALIRSTE